MREAVPTPVIVLGSGNLTGDGLAYALSVSSAGPYDGVEWLDVRSANRR